MKLHIQWTEFEPGEPDQSISLPSSVIRMPAFGGIWSNLRGKSQSHARKIVRGRMQTALARYQSRQCG